VDTLLTCPRCKAYVQPEWPTCKICGFDPSNEATYTPIHRAKREAERPGFVQVLGGLVTLAVLVTVLVVAGRFAFDRYERGTSTGTHQEVVHIDR